MELQCDKEEIRRILEAPLSDQDKAEMDEHAQQCGADIIGDAEVAMLRLGFAVHRYMNVLLSFISNTYEKLPKDTSRNACIYVDGIKAQK